MGEIYETAANDIVAVVILIVKQTCESSVLQVLQFSLTPPSEDAATKNALSWRHHAQRPGKGAPARTAGANAKHSGAQETRRRAHTHLRSRSSLSHTHTQNKTVWLHHMACTKSPTAVFFNPF